MKTTTKTIQEWIKKQDKKLPKELQIAVEVKEMHVGNKTAFYSGYTSFVLHLVYTDERRYDMKELFSMPTFHALKKDYEQWKKDFDTQLQNPVYEVFSNQKKV